MNKEEKKAIEYIREEFIADWRRKQQRINKDAFQIYVDKEDIDNIGKVLNLIEKQEKEIEKSYKVKFKVGEKARLKDGHTIGCMGSDHNKEVIIREIIITTKYIRYYVDYIKDGEIHNFMVGLEDSDLIEL